MKRTSKLIFGKKGLIFTLFAAGYIKYRNYLTGFNLVYERKRSA